MCFCHVKRAETALLSLFLLKFPLRFLASCRKQHVLKSSRLRSEATNTPVGLLSGRTVLRSKMEGPRPDKFTFIAVCVFHAQATSANGISQRCHFDRHSFWTLRSCKIGAYPCWHGRCCRCIHWPEYNKKDGLCQNILIIKGESFTLFAGQQARYLSFAVQMQSCKIAKLTVFTLKIF